MPDIFDQVTEAPDVFDQIPDADIKRIQKRTSLLEEMAKEAEVGRVTENQYRFLAGLSQVTEPYTAAGMLNQPTRALGIPDPFQAGVGIPIPEPQGETALAGLGKLAARTLSSLTTPEMILEAPAAGASSLVRATFGAQMAGALPGQVERAAQVLGTPTTTPAERVLAIGEPVVTAAMTAGLAAPGFVRTPTERSLAALERPPREIPFPPEATPEEAALFAQRFTVPKAPEQVLPAAKEPVQVEQAPLPTEAPVAAGEAISQVFTAKGATDVLYEKIFQAAKVGETTVSGVRDPLLVEATPLIQSGQIKSPTQLKEWVETGKPTPEAARPSAAPLAEPTPKPAEVPVAEAPVAAEPLRIEALGLSEADLTPGKIKAMPASNPAQWAAVKKYFGVKSVPEAQKKIAARFEQMRQPKEVAAPVESVPVVEAPAPEPPPVAAAKAQAEVSRVVRTEGKRSAQEIKDDLIAEIQDRLQKAPSEPVAKETVTIEIPDDGTFVVPNTVEALSGMLARAKKIQIKDKPPGVPKKAIAASAEAIRKTSSERIEREATERILEKANEKREVERLALRKEPIMGDAATEKHFLEWIESVVHRDDRLEVERAIRSYLKSNPEGLESRSWTEVRRAAEIWEAETEAAAYRKAKQAGEEPERPQSMGPGAAARAEFDLAAQEANRGVFGRLIDWIKSRRIPDNPNIKEKVKDRDVMAGRQWINSPEYLFRKDPVAAPLVSRIVEAQLRHNDRASKDTIHFQEATKGMDEAAMKRITTALKMQEAGESNPFAILRPEERVVAQEIRTYFDQWKERLREQKVQKIIDALPDARGRAVKAIQDGESFEAAVKANKLRGAGKEAVRVALREIEEARKWGIENYVTHAEQGPWRIVTEDGTTVAVAETKAEAYHKAESYLTENPGTGKLTLDDSFDPGFDWPSQLTPPAYGKLLSNLEKSTGQTAKELQAALRKTAPGIVIKPTSKYSRFLTKRYGVLKGEENIMDILPSYIYSMHKKMELDPVLKEARTTMPKLGPETRQAVEALLGDVKGQKYLGDKIVDHVLSGASGLVEKATGFSLPIKPFGFSRGVNVLRNISAHLKLGYRPISVLINRLGGIQHTWTKTGFADFLKGRRWIKTEEGKRLTKENEAEMGLTAAFVTEGRLSREEPWYKPLGLFQKMEHFNRPEAFGAFYIQATKRMGLTGDAAVQYARNATRFAQFTYNTAALPKIMRGPAGRLVFQFKPYLVKELEFISSLRGAEIPRYMAGFLAMGGPRAAVILLKSLPFLGAIGAIRELEDWLNQQAPRATRGVAGFAGADVSAAAAPQLPSTAGDWVGPALNDYVRLWNEVVGPAIKGEEKDWSDVGNWASRTAPALFYMKQAVESILGEQGWVTDARGRHQFQPSKWDKAKLMLGVTPLEKSVQQSEQRYLLETEDIQRKNKQHWLDNVADAVERNDEKRLNALLEDGAEFYASRKDFEQALKQNLKQRSMEPRERLFRRLSKMTRMREAGRFIEEPTK